MHGLILLLGKINRTLVFQVHLSVFIYLLPKQLEISGGRLPNHLGVSHIGKF